MPSRILCPECRAAFAYSPALLGTTVQCGQCGHQFTVSGAVEDLPVGAHAPEEGVRVPSPPPLPARAAPEQYVAQPPIPEPDEPVDDRPRHRPDQRDRPGNAGVLAGLAVAVVLGFAVIVGGLVYIVWPGSARPTNPAGDGPSPAAAAPVVPEPPQRFEDIIREAPRKDDNRGRAGPDFPDFNPPPGRAAGGGPQFARVVPLPVTPARLAGDREEVPIPGPVESVAVAGGGRYLLLHVPKTSQVLVFDVSAARVVRAIGVPDPAALVAGGMNLFVIYQPGKNTIERWSCDKLEQQWTGKAPFTDPVKALAMGCASNGPLVAALGGKRRSSLRGATLAYFDPANMNELPYMVTGAENAFGIGPADTKGHIRVSSDGKVITGWSPELPSGTECDVLVDRWATRHWDLHAPRPLLPGPDGELLFGRGETFRHDMRGGRAPDSPLHYVPAVSGPWYVAVRGPPVEPPADGTRAESVAIYQIGKDAPAVTFTAVKDIDLSRADQGLDQTIVLVPPAQVLVTVAGPERTRLVLRRVELK